MDELMQERYQANLQALSECIQKGVSEDAVRQLAFECGLDKRDLEMLFNRRVA